ncbi:ATP/GTP-binding protein [Arthrobacter sp. NEB 688]|uniref:ATP/GTP-binding protein n=1 Tax=Arthrobacter sp. NEB 688 TaxID=904039 RepID=UPI0015667D69|nr:ATP/GTP-binding protein [Arthrobacter sp. NEB 688]QKE85135.1 ATP/GTP-binding protein [Arthrobacter sp. NEB 688]
MIYLVWLAEPPNGAPPNPASLAARAVETMNLRAVSIGIVPESRPDAIGLVGMPVWMWNASDAAETWGPVTKSASAGGYTVTATAKVEKVVWAMGDGHVVVCRTSGTAYRDSYGKSESPTCGYRYDQQGRYTVRATSYWRVDWSGIGQSGSIPLQFSDSVVITVGEVQVLTQ